MSTIIGIMIGLVLSLPNLVEAAALERGDAPREGVSLDSSRDSMPILERSASGRMQWSSVRYLLEEEDEKKRVPKERKKEKGEETEQSDESDESGGDDSCLSILGCLASLGSSDDEAEASLAEIDETEVTLTEIGEPEPAAPRIPATDFQTGSTGIIAPRHSDSLPLWSAPGGKSQGAEVLYRLDRGSRVLVSGSAAVEGIPWSLVSPLELDAKSAWLDSRDLGTPPVEEPEPLPRPQWQWELDLSILGVIGADADIDKEYRDAGFGGGLGARRFLGRLFCLSAAYHYTYQDGDPRFDFETSTLIDRPTDSDIQTHSLRVLAGLSWTDSDGSPVTLSWGIGPSLIHVRESAKIEFEELEGEVVVRSGQRRDSLGKWRVGIATEFAVSGQASRSVPIGGAFGLIYVPWKSEEEESLTLDWLRKETLWILYGGLKVGYSIF